MLIFIELVMALYQGMAEIAMSPERLAALVVVATGVMSFCFWAVTSIVTGVIRQEMTAVNENIQKMDIRLTVVETKIMENRLRLSRLGGEE